MKGAQKLDEDPFASMIKLCLPTDSQEIELQFCPMARESENFEDIVSSSPELSPSQRTPILMISQSDSAGTGTSEEENGSVFHTPPENHIRSISSSEQNFVDFGDAFAELKRSRVYEGESESKTLMVSEGDDVVADMLPIGGETEGNESAGDTEIVELDSLDSDETVNLDSDTVVVGKVDAVFLGGVGGELLKGTVRENHELRMNCEIMEDVKVSKEKNHYESSGSELSEIEEETAKVKSITTDECYEMKDESIVAGFKKIVEDKSANEDGGDVNKGEKHCENSEIAAITTIDEEIVKLMCTAAADGCHKSSIVPECEEVIKVGEAEKLSKSKNADGNIDVIDKFMYAGGSGIKRRWKARLVRDSEVSDGKRRKSPLSMKKKEKKNVAEKIVETKNGILNFLDVLKEVFEGGSENVDFLEMAKKRGVTFLRPRWWPPE